MDIAHSQNSVLLHQAPSHPAKTPRSKPLVSVGAPSVAALLPDVASWHHFPTATPLRLVMRLQHRRPWKQLAGAAGLHPVVAKSDGAVRLFGARRYLGMTASDLICRAPPLPGLAFSAHQLDELR